MKELGVGPKKLLDIVRFQYVLQRLHQGPAIPLTDLALAYGYSDQPHFSADFKRFYGLSPKQAFQPD
nr:helix-turn-helix domain-containing protein [Paenibacillus glycinis]